MDESSKNVVEVDPLRKLADGFRCRECGATGRHCLGTAAEDAWALKRVVGFVQGSDGVAALTEFLASVGGAHEHYICLECRRPLKYNHTTVYVHDTDTLREFLECCSGTRPWPDLDVDDMQCAMEDAKTLHSELRRHEDSDVERAPRDSGGCAPIECRAVRAPDSGFVHVTSKLFDRSWPTDSAGDNAVLVLAGRWNELLARLAEFEEQVYRMRLAREGLAARVPAEMRSGTVEEDLERYIDLVVAECDRLREKLEVVRGVARKRLYSSTAAVKERLLIHVEGIVDDALEPRACSEAREGKR